MPWVKSGCAWDQGSMGSVKCGVQGVECEVWSVKYVFVASPIDTATLPSRRPRTHILPHTRRMSQSATPATQNDMSTSSDTSNETRFVASPIDTATLPSRRPRTHIPPHTRRTSQSATPATQKDTSTSSDKWRGTRSCVFPQRHGNFSATGRAHTHSSWNTSNVTKLAQSTSQYYLLLQSLHKARPSTISTTSYYKARIKYFPVLLRTTKLARSTSQYYFVLYKACTKYVPVLLRTIQSVHKVRPSTKRHEPNFLTLRERHVCVAFLTDTATLPSRRPRTHIPPHTRRMSQSATPATQKRHEHIFWHVEKDTFLWLPP